MAGGAVRCRLLAFFSFLLYQVSRILPRVEFRKDVPALKLRRVAVHLQNSPSKTEHPLRSSLLTVLEFYRAKPSTLRDRRNYWFPNCEENC